MFFDRECTDLLIKLKKYLRSGNYHNEEKEIDYILCQYDSKNIQTKRQFLDKIIALCAEQAYGNLVIPDIDHSAWIEFIISIRNTFALQLSELERKVAGLPVSEVIYDGKRFDCLLDMIQWVQTDDILIVLLKYNGKYFQDNIAAFDLKGNYLWSTKETINITDRDGAVFVSLGQVQKESVHAIAWVGINYELDVTTGKIINKVIVK